MSLPADPHSQALLCSSSQEIMGGCGFTPALVQLLAVSQLIQLVAALANSHTVHARSGHTLLAGSAGPDSLTVTKELQASAIISLQKQVLQVLALPAAQP